MSLFSSSPLLLNLLGAFRCGTALLAIGVQNPVHSLLLLIRVFLLGTLLLFLLQREYFAILFLIVYVGAIVVLFLFLIRRLELKRVNTARRFRDLFARRHRVRGLLILEVLLLVSADAFDLAPFLANLDFAALVVELPLVEANGSINWSGLLHRTDHLRGLGGILYTEYSTTLLLAALLLLLSIRGAIALTLPILSDDIQKGRLPHQLGTPRTIKRQDGVQQALRHPSLAISTLRTPLALLLETNTFINYY